MSAERTGGERRIRVWDAPTRLFHWLLALFFLLCFSTGEGWATFGWLTGAYSAVGSHVLFGQIVLGLLFFRLIWGFVGSDTARFTHFVRGPGAVIRYLRGDWRGVGHNPLGALSVCAMIGLLCVHVGLGLFANDDIFTDAPLAHLTDKATSDRLTGLHGLTSKLLLALVALHLAAILFYRLRLGRNLTAEMITGRTAADAPEPRFAGLGRAAAAAGIAAAAAWALTTQI